MKDFAGSYPVYSPRWGHDDTYHLTFAADGLTLRAESACGRERGGPT